MTSIPNPLEHHVPEHVLPPASPHARLRSLDHACRAARILDELRGQNTLVLDLTHITPIVDYFVITTATSTRQMRAQCVSASPDVRVMCTRAAVSSRGVMP
jgi:hypothetical protein